MTTIHFIRHGYVLDPQNIYYGRLPGFPLSDEGRKCIEETAQSLKAFPITAVYSSPLLRCSQSAEIIASIFKLPVTIDDRITELATSLEGQNREALKDIKSESEANKESLEDIYDRMLSFVREVANSQKNTHVVAVSHGGPINILKLGLVGQPLTLDNYDRASMPECGSDTTVTVDGQIVTCL